MSMRYRRAALERAVHARNGARPQVRRPSANEHTTLRRWAGNADPPRRRRARAILLALDGNSLRTISRATGVHPRTVQHWLHRFNVRGPDGLPPLKPTGRPTRWTDDTLDRVRAVVSVAPLEYGFDRMEWSLRSLAEYLYRESITPTRSPETLRTWLRKMAVELRG